MTSFKINGSGRGDENKLSAELFKSAAEPVKNCHRPLEGQGRRNWCLHLATTSECTDVYLKQAF